MDNIGIIEQMKNVELFNALSMGEKMYGAAITAILGMGITFIALIILMYSIKAMSAVMNKKSSTTPPPAESLPTTAAAANTATAAVVEDDAEIIAVISAAIAALSGGSAIVKNIYRAPVESGWTASGREELFDSRRITIQKRS